MIHKKITIDISFKSYLLAALVFFTIIFFRNVANILTLLFISFLIAVAINPLINFLESKRIPRGLSAFIVLFGIFSGLIYLAVSLITPLVDQTISFIQQFPLLIERLAPYQIDLSSVILPQINSAPGNVVKIAVGTFSGALALFTLVVISYYLIQERPHLKKNLTSLLDSSKAEKYLHAIELLESKLGHWVRGELLLMILVGLLNYVGFVLIGLPSAIPLAVIAGALELVPNIGPTVAAVPAIIVGLSISPTHALLTAGLAILIQQLENNVIVPKIMQKAVGLHPVITILVLSIGFRLGGPLLAVLALPLVLSLRVVYSHLHSPQKREIENEIKEGLSL
jgi:predicted PurR-regulated permease PerM